MENQIGDWKSFLRPATAASLLLRIGATVSCCMLNAFIVVHFNWFGPMISPQVLAIIILILSAATLGVILTNEDLRDVITSPTLNEVELLGVTVNTQRSAGWLIFQAVAVVIAEIIAMVLMIPNIAHKGRLVLDIIVSMAHEISFHCMIYAPSSNNY